MDEARRMQLQLASLVQPITSSNRPSTARHAAAAPVPRARPLAALVSPPGATPVWRSSAPLLAVQAGTARPETARPNAPCRGWAAVAADQFLGRDAGHITARDSSNCRERTKSEQLDAPRMRRSMSEQLKSSGPMVSPPSHQRSTSGLHEHQEARTNAAPETTAHKATGARTTKTKTDALRPHVVTSSARRTAKGLFRRQSIAEIIAEGRELKTHRASVKEGCPPEGGGETSLLMAAEAAAAARVRRASARQDSDAARQLPEDALLKAAAAAAFAKIGSIQVNRTRSRSTSPGRSARSREIGRDDESGRNESPLGSPIMRTGSRGSVQGTINTPMLDCLRFSVHASSMHACMALQ